MLKAVDYNYLIAFHLTLSLCFFEHNRRNFCALIA